MNWPERQPRGDTFDWIIRQLQLQPYQHILEVGYGSGRLLTEVARTIRIGFLAGIESSIPLYRQAYRRNRAFIRQELMQLHIGQFYELPYPAHYFHTIYGCDVHHAWNNFATESLRLASLLRIGGRLVLLSSPRRDRNEEDLRTEAARLQSACLSAGLTDIHAEYREFAAGKGLAVIGFKPDMYADTKELTTVNNRLLNPEAYFISNVARMQI
jgi:SAM-dependent methyltransferase